MTKPIKYAVYVKSGTIWYPLYHYKNDKWFIKRMNNIARFSPSLKVQVRLSNELDNTVEWFTARFHQNGWELQENTLTYSKGVLSGEGS